MNRPRILIYDVETAPILADVWSLWNNNVGLNQIRKDWYILSWSAKWLGSKKVMYKDQRHRANIENDRILLKHLWSLLDEADIVITHNGKKFDQKRIYARFLAHGMQPPSAYRHIDTLEIARRNFGFTSNRLAYLTDKLCKKNKKLSHGKFPGHILWTECIKGNPAAWAEMERYNRADVTSLEELYLVLRPWCNKSINFNAYSDDEVYICACGSDKFSKNGFAYTNTGKFQIYKCKSCGHQTKDSVNLLGKGKRKSLRRNI